jgi:hypothetical protein
MQPALGAFHGRFCRAIEALDLVVPPAPVPLAFDGAALAAWRRENARRGRRDSVLDGLRSASQIPGVRFAWRSLEAAGRRLLGA